VEVRPEAGDHAPANRDDWCFGFDSEQLATALNITTDSLFQANRDRKLTLENVEASTPDGEMALIFRFYASAAGPFSCCACCRKYQALSRLPAAPRDMSAT